MPSGEPIGPFSPGPAPEVSSPGQPWGALEPAWLYERALAARKKSRNASLRPIGVGGSPAAERETPPPRPPASPACEHHFLSRFLSVCMLQPLVRGEVSHSLSQSVGQVPAAACWLAGRRARREWSASGQSAAQRGGAGQSRPSTSSGDSSRRGRAVGRTRGSRDRRPPARPPRQQSPAAGGRAFSRACGGCTGTGRAGPPRPPAWAPAGCKHPR